MNSEGASLPRRAKFGTSEPVVLSESYARRMLQNSKCHFWSHLIRKCDVLKTARTGRHHAWK
jgi:hypothetical protein